MPLLIFIFAFSAAGQLIYSEDFNANNGGFFKSGNSTFDWGEPSGDTGPGSAHSAPKAWATNLFGNYATSESGFITSPLIDLSAHVGDQFVLSWWEHLDTEADFDFARVEASINSGVAWHAIYGEFSGPISTPGWQRRSAVLGASHAVSSFRFRFHLRSDDSENRAGYYVDDITLLALPISHIYAEDFESGSGGYTSVGISTWTLGTPSTGPSAAASGTQAWATNLDGFYDANESGHLLSPIIDASPAVGDPTGLLLSWQQYISTENTRDFASVEASADGNNWTPVYGPFSGPIGGPFQTWRREAAIIPPSFATATLQLRFRLTTDDSIANLGFYLDDITLSRTAATIPSASAFALSGTEDIPLPLAVADFANAFSGSIATVRIETTPAHGDLVLADTIMNPGVELSPFSVDALFYIPDSNYDGTDSFTWNATDGLFFSPEAPAVTISLSGTNDPPTGLTLTPATVPEITPGALVGTLAAIDPDGDDIHSFRIADPRFVIVGDQLSLAPDAALDYESEPSIPGSITTTDALGFASLQVVIISVSDVNEPPIFLINTLVIDEGATVVLTAAEITASDPEGSPLTYTVLSTTHGEFRLGNSPISEFASGFIGAGGLNFIHDGSPTAPSYTLLVSDGSATATRSATIFFNDSNDAPVLHSAKLVVSEGGSPPLTPAGFNSTDEEDGAANITYSISNITGGVFQRTATGETITNFTQADVNAFAIRFVDDDNENPPSFIVQISDSGGRTAGPTSGSVIYTSVNDAPTAIFLDNDSAPESPGASVANILVSDPDDTTHSFAVSDGRFEVVANTLKLKVGVAIDHETEPSVSIELTATDPGGKALTRSVSIDITNVNEAPTAIALATDTVSENALGASIGTLSVSDPDANSAHSFAVSDFRFEVSDLELKLKDGQSLDFESADVIVLTLTATDNGFPARSFNLNFAINVIDQNDAPLAVHLDVSTLEENDIGVVVGSFEVVDQDAGDSHNLAIADARFVLSGKQLSLAPGVSLNHEATPTITLAVSATDFAGSVLDATVSLSISDRNEPPTAVALSSTDLAESADAAVVGAIIIADPDADAANQNIVTVDDSRFTIADSALRLVDGVQVDHETEPSIDIVLTVTDNANNSFTASTAITVTVLDLNEAPTVVLLDNRFIDENSTGLLGTLSALDPDDGDSHSFSVDDSRLGIVGDQLSLLVPIDYETTPTIPIVLTATDSGGLTRDGALAIIISNANEAPTAIALDNLLVVENFPDATVGAITVSDPDAGDSHSFVLSDPRFAITAGDLVLTAPLDHESDDPTPLLITATDALGLANSASFSISVIDAPDTPSAVLIDNSSVPENAPGAIVGILTVLDDDFGDSHTLAVDDSRFEITGSTLRLRSDTVFDHELTPSVAIQVTAIDSTGLAFDQPITVAIADLNEPPTDITLANSAIAENATGAIGAITVADQDAGATHVFSLSDARFSIVDGQLQLNTPIDHEAEPSITLSISATDTGNANFAVSRVSVIAIGNIDEPPTAILLSNASITENSTGAIASITLQDPDTLAPITVSGPSFSIIESTLHLLTPQDHETTPTLSFILTSDGFSQSFTISITNANEPPTALALSPASISENSIAGLIGTLTVSDPDTPESHILSAADPRFVFLGSTLRLAADTALDHEADPTLDLLVTATDGGGLSFSDTLTIVVTNIAEPPTAITVVPASIPENTTGSLGTITVTDPDGIAPVTLTDPRFSIIGDQLHLISAQDHETTPSITLDLSGFSTTIAITNIDEPPSAITLSGTTIAENLSGLIGTLTVTDPDGHSAPVLSDARFQLIDSALHLIAPQDHETTPSIPLTITIDGVAQAFNISIADGNEPPTDITFANSAIPEDSSGELTQILVADPDPDPGAHILIVDDPRFEITGSTLRLRAGQALDHETEPIVTLSLTATDADSPTLSVTVSRTLSITNVNEPPVALVLTPDSIDENTGGLIGILAVTDPDAGDSHSLATGDSRVTLDGSSLSLALAQNHEITPSIDLAFTVTDAAGLTLTTTVVVTIANLDEPPSAIALSNTAIPENSSGLVGTITLTDPDALAPITASDPSFTVHENALHLLAPLDHETRPTVPLTLSSGGYSQSFTLTVTNANEAPSAITLANSAILENTVGPIGAIAVADPDDGDGHSFLVSDARFAVIGGVLHASTQLNHENTPSISVDITARDGGGLAFTETHVITISDANEVPTSLSLDSVDILENQPGAIVGALTIADPDADDSHTVTTSDPRFLVAAGNLRLAADIALDFEAAAAIPLTLTATDSGGLSRAHSFTLIVFDANDPPRGLALSDATVAESAITAPIGTLSASDQDGDTVSFVADDPRFAIVGNALSLAAGGLDFETEPGIALRITATDARGASSTATFSITVTNVNEPPTTLSISSDTIVENALAAAIGDITVSDPDAGASHVFAVDDSRFEVIGTTLRLKGGVALDHETDPSVAIVLSAIDAANPAFRIDVPLTITVTDIDEPPTAIALSSAEIAENSAGSVGTLTISDPDATSSVTVSDPRFTVGEDLVLLAPLNHETTPSIALSISADGFTQAFTIQIADVPEPPSAITLTPLGLPENTDNLLIAELEAIDEDANDDVTLGTDDPRFSLSGGFLRLRAGHAVDFETTPSLSVSITGTDLGGLELTETFTLAVTNLNEAPTAITLAATTVPENDPSASLGAISVSDPDADASHFLSVDDPRFDISEGILSLEVALDREAEPTVAIAITATDAGGLQITQPFTITVSDINEPPTAITVAPASIAENTTGSVGSISITDPDAIDPVVITDPRFQIIGDQLHLVQAQDHETNPSIALDLSGFSATITITNFDEPPTAIALSSAEIAENTTGRIGTLSVTDPDTSNHSLSVDDNRFVVIGNDLHLQQPFDHETTPSVPIIVSAGGFDQALTILIGNTNEAPSAVALSAATIAENTVADIGTVTVTDLDQGDSHILAVDDPRFDIIGGILRPLAPLNHETDPSIPIRITATDAAGFANFADFTITVSDVDEPPTAITVAPASILENSTGSVGTIIVTDPDAVAPVVVTDPRFSIIEDQLHLVEAQDHENTPGITIDLSGFSVSVAIVNANEAPSAISLAGSGFPENSTGPLMAVTIEDPDANDSHSISVSDPRFSVVDGVLTLAENINHEPEPTVTLTLTATDTGGLARVRVFILTVGDRNEAPTGIALSAATIFENSTGAIGDLTVSDPDVGAAHLLTADDARFEVLAGKLRLREPLDHETTPSLPITITATDLGDAALSVSETFTITVANVDEPPTAIAISANSIAENNTGIVGALTVTDLDSASHSLTLNDLRFDILAGNLRLLSPQDHETTPSIDIIVSTDGFDQALTIVIADVNEPPTALALAHAEIAEHATGRVGQITVTDPDASPAIPTASAPFTVIHGALHLSEAQNHETTPSLFVTLTADSYTQTFSISIADVNEPPTAIALSSATIAENAIGLLGNLSVTDPDESDIHVFTVDDSRFGIDGTGLRLLAPLDHETTPTLDVIVSSQGFSETFTITVTDVGEPPTAIALSSTSIDEHSSGLVGTLSVSDPDEGEIHSFTLDDTRFAINGAELRLLSPLDHETIPSIDIAITTQGFTQAFTIIIADLNEPPTGVFLAGSSIDENSTGRVGDISIIDPDIRDIHVFTSSDPRFAVADGELRLLEAIDHETTPSISLTLSTQGVATSFIITIIDINEPPSAITLSNAEIAENSPGLLGTLSVVDPDGGSHSFTLDDDRFAIFGNLLALLEATDHETEPSIRLGVTAQGYTETLIISIGNVNEDSTDITLANANITENVTGLIGSITVTDPDAAPVTPTVTDPSFTIIGDQLHLLVAQNHETTPSLSVRLRAEGYSEVFTIAIDDVNEPPTAITVAPASIAENTSGSVGSISITDEDTIDPVVPSDARFQVIGDQLHLIAPQNHESTPSISFDLSGFSTTVEITDVDDPVTGIALSNVEIAENSIGPVGALTIRDQDATASVAVSDPRFSVGEDLVLLEPLNHETEPTVALTITADGISQSFTLTVTNVDEPPTAIALSNTEIAENSAGLIGLITITDPDNPVARSESRLQAEVRASFSEPESGAQTLAKAREELPPEGGTPTKLPQSNAARAAAITLSDTRLIIIDSALHLASPQNHEATPSIPLTITVDGFSQAFTVIITDLNEPPIFTNNSLAIDEDATVVLTADDLLASDPDGDPLTITPTAVTHGSFSAAAFTPAQVLGGSITFTHDGSQNPPAYQILLSDGALSVSSTATIFFNDANDRPQITEAGLTIGEGGSADPVLTATDEEDDNASLSFSISEVTGGSYTAPTFIHDGGESPPSFLVSVTDSGGRTAGPIAATITFISVDDPPTAITLSPASIAENSTGAIGTITQADPDELAPVVLNDARFQLIGDQLHLLQPQDHETTPSITLELSGFSTTVTITNIDEPPTAITLANSAIPENSVGPIGALTITDPDSTSALIVSDARFSVGEDLVLLQPLDHETEPSVALVITADGVSKSFTITISNIDEPPTAITLSNAEIAENSTGFVGSITISDPDAVAPIVLSDPRFQIIGDQLHLVQAQDHESTPSITLELSGFSTTVVISNIDEPPTAITVAPASIAENTTGSVGTISISDPDAVAPVTLADPRFQIIDDQLHLVQAQDHETTPSITIDLSGFSTTISIADTNELPTAIALSTTSIPENSSGFLATITLADPDTHSPVTVNDPRFGVIDDQLHLLTPQDRETTPSISIILSSNGFEQGFVINISNIDEPPTAITVAPASIAENTTGSVGSISITDPDAIAPLVLGDSRFQVIDDQLHLLTPQDHETTPAITLSLSDFDVTVSITNIAEQPTAISLSTVSIAENVTGLIGAITVTDPDVLEPVAVDDGRFAIIDSALHLTQALDHETTPTVPIVLSSAGFTQAFTILIADTNEPPTAIALSSTNIPENSTGAVATLLFTDPDAITPATVDDARFEIIAGDLHLRTSQNHEDTPSIPILISSNGFDQPFTIAIADINEPPTAIILANSVIPENSTGTIGAVTITDPDATENLSVDDPRFSIGEDLVLLQPLDHETEPSVSLVITADGVSQSVTISVTNIDEPPTSITVAPASIAENNTGSVGSISIIDSDAILPVTLSDPRFQVIGDQLHLVQAQDHESTPSITVDLSGFSTRIAITDVNESPTAIALSGLTVPENSTGALIGDIPVTDPDDNANPIITVDDPRFRIANGQLRLAPGIALDHETTPTVSITLTADDYSQTFTISVSDIDEPPSAIALSSTEFSENTTGLIGTITITDPEGDAHSPIVVDPSFTVIGDQLHALQPFDHEATPTHTLDISGFSVTLTILNIDEPPSAITVAPGRIAENSTGSVGGITITDPDLIAPIVLSDARFQIIGDQLQLLQAQDHETTPNITVDLSGFSVTIAITNIDEPPTAITLSNSEIDENRVGGIVGSVSISDPDTTGPASVSDARLTIANGQLRLRAGQFLDHEAEPTVPLTISADSFSQAFTITVRDIAELPTAIAISANSIPENQSGIVGAITITDPDATVTLSVDDPRFSVGEDLVLLEPLNHEVTASIPIVISADGYSQAFVISISDIDEPPTSISLANSEIPENSSGLIGSLIIDDPDAVAPVVLSDPRFEVIEDALHLIAPLDHETTPSITLDLSGFSVTILISNVNEAPQVTLADASVLENQPGAILGPISISDPDAGDSHSFSLNDPRFAVQGGLLKAIAGFDHEAADTLPLSVTVTDALGLANSATVTISVLDENEPPVSISLSGSTFAESATLLIANITVGDPDDSDTHELSIDDPRFKLENRELRNLVPFDHETEPTVAVAITATDSGGLSVVQSFVLSVDDIDEPPTLTLLNNSIPENLLGLIGELQIVDPDDGDTHTPTVDDPRFVFDGNLLKAAQPLDHELTPTIDLLILGQTLRIHVLDENEPPTGIALSNSGVAESATGALIGAITVTDPDAGDSHDLAVDDPRFRLANGTLLLAPGQAFDHETDESISIQITATDANSLELTLPFVISIVDINEPPVLSATPAPIPENQRDILVATVSIADPDDPDSHDLSVSDPRFEFAELNLMLREPIDFEAEPSISLNLAVSDAGGLSHTLALQLSVEDANDPPSAFLLSGLSIAENATGPIGTVSITDQDDSDLVVVDDANFAILEGVLQLLTPQDHETQPEIPIILSSNGFSQSFVIQITPIDEAPTGIAISANQIDENSIGPIGSVTVTDPDQTNSLTVTDPRFEIQDGVLRLLTPLDHETEPTVDLTFDADGLQQMIQIEVVNGDEPPTEIELSAQSIIENSTGQIGDISITDPDQIPAISVNNPAFEITDSALYLRTPQNHESTPTISVDLSAGGFSQSFTISIDNTDDLPTALSLSSSEIPENQSGIIGTIIISDEDSTQTITVDDDRFEIEDNNLSLRTPQNHELLPSIPIVISADGFDQSFTILISDENEAPTGIGVSSLTVPENKPSTAIGVVSVTDEDNSTNHLLSVDDSRFQISNGVLRTTQSLDHEDKPDIIIMITVNDGSASVTDSFTVVVEDVNEAPSLTLDLASIEENVAAAIVGAVGVSDPDLGDSHSFAVDDGRFEIAGGQLKLLNDTTLDFEGEPTVLLNLTVTDAGGLTDSRLLEVTLTNANEPPSGLSLSDDAIAENTAGVIGTITVSDPDAGDTHGLVVDDARFSIVNGVLLSEALDHETAETVALSITVTDAGGLVTGFPLTIRVLDVNEPPSLSVDIAEIAENTPGAVVGAITVTDPDEGASVALAVDDPRFEVGDFLKLREGISLNHEDAAQVPLTITATDGGLSVEFSVNAPVSDVNEPPTGIILSANLVDENVVNIDIGNMTVNDPDESDTHGLTVSDNRFEIVNSVLRIIGSINFESEPSVDIIVTATDDDGLVYSEIIVITVTNVNEAPVLLSGEFQVDENVVAVNIGSIPVVDVDFGSILEFESDDPRFTIQNGILRLADGIGLDHEADSSITLGLNVTDQDGLSDSALFTVLVNDRNDSPHATILNSQSVMENIPGAQVGMLSVADSDSGDAHRFVLNDARFVVVDGLLKLSSVALDFETEATLSLEIQTIDNGTPPASRIDVFEITVLNGNEAPTGISLSAALVAENVSDVGIGTLTVSDPDQGDSHTVTVDDTRFRVEAGELRLEIPLDAETEPTVPLLLTAIDAGGLSVSASVTITVNNVNERPVVDFFAVRELAESAIGFTKGLNLVIDSFTSDVDNAINGWLVSEESGSPAFDDPGWQEAPISEFAIVDIEGDHKLFAWARDEGGLVSVANSASIRFVRPQLLKLMLNGDEAVFGTWEAGTVGTEGSLDAVDAGGALVWASGLQTDVRGDAALTHWRLLVRQDGELTWDFSGLPAGQELVLQRIGADRRPDGAPVAISARTGLDVQPGDEFELAFGVPEVGELVLEAGWNLIGNPIYTEMMIGELLGEDVVCWRWEHERYVRVNAKDVLSPKWGYWCYRPFAETLQLAGLRGRNDLGFNKGWELWAPVRAQRVDGADLLGFDGGVQGYVSPVDGVGLPFYAYWRYVVRSFMEEGE